jgi:NarL family two-component system sensor histidine kinase LiaS
VSTRLQDRSILAAQPVLDDGNVVGVVYLRIASFSLLAPSILGGALGIIGGSALLLTIGAGFVGTLFGFLTARGLVRRLETLADTTEAWGRGDFAATVDDISADEIGQLSRRLDLMAGEIQDLLQARQELATLEERYRLARDLHDSVKQQVFATTMNLGAAETLWERDPEAARQKVAQALAISRESQQELTGLIHELRPVTLEGKELFAALREHVTRWSRQAGIVAGVAVQGEGALPLEVEQAFFRVAQEALANVAKHSAASRVEVTLSCSGDSVILQVRDDGQGFVLPAAGGQGMGLRSMRERVEALGGDLRVESAPGEGTCVTVRCGLEPAPEGGASA